MHLVGHSLGGAVAALVAAAKPTRVASLSLIAPAGIGTAINGAFLDGLVQEVRGKKLRPVLEMLVTDPDMVTSDMVEDVLKFKAPRRRGSRPCDDPEREFPGLRPNPSRSRMPLRPWTCRCRSSSAREDRIIPPEQAEALPASVRKTAIAKAGHIPHMEKSGEVNGALGKLWG